MAIAKLIFTFLGAWLLLDLVLLLAWAWFRRDGQEDEYDEGNLWPPDRP